MASEQWGSQDDEKMELLRQLNQQLVDLQTELRKQEQILNGFCPRSRAKVEDCHCCVRLSEEQKVARQQKAEQRKQEIQQQVTGLREKALKAQAA